MFILFSLLLFVSAALAAPALFRRDVPQGLLTQLEYLAQYSSAAYCPGNHQPGSTNNVNCPGGFCPLVEAAGATTLLEYQNVGPVDGTGFVAVDHARQLLVLSFRGSRSVARFTDWLANLNIFQQPYSVGDCTLCTVHSGFHDTWNAVKPDVEATLASARAQWPSYRIVATGHSLGGAVAAIAAGELREGGFDVDLYSYGAPMSGNLGFVNYISRSGNNYRVTNKEDIVPKLPGYLLGYAHVSDEYWITSPNEAPVTTRDIEVSSGAFNLRGNKGTLGANGDDHQWYFGYITGCGDEDLELPQM